MQLKLGEESKGWALVDQEGHVALCEICTSLSAAESLKSAAQSHQPHRGPLVVTPVIVGVCIRAAGGAHGSQR